MLNVLYFDIALRHPEYPLASDNTRHTTSKGSCSTPLNSTYKITETRGNEGGQTTPMRGDPKDASPPQMPGKGEAEKSKTLLLEPP